MTNRRAHSGGIDRERVRALRRQGLTERVIAERMGITKARVHQILHEEVGGADVVQPVPQKT